MSANYFDRIHSTPHSTTGTGLDGLVDTMATDFGLTGRISDKDLVGGAEAANEMNIIILKAIEATGAGSDGVFTVDDVRELNGYIRANYLSEWTALHGDDEKGEETGFHLLQNDGATSRYRGDNLVNTVADGIYHLGFAIEGDRLLNEDGDANATLQQVADWLTQFVTDHSTTETGLDRMTDMVMADAGLSRRIPDHEIAAGADYSDDMAHIIKEAIEKTKIAQDNVINAEDVRVINEYIREHHQQEWVRLHGDDEDGEETGFHLVQNDGATTRMFGKNFVNTVLDGINHLGFEIKGNTLYNEDGNANADIADVASWLNYFYVDQSTTNTGLDYLVDGIKSDEGLSRNTSAADINAGADAANEMNKILVEAIKETRAGEDGVISVDDVRAVNAYIRENHLERWVELHGDDEECEETGFHLVQNDGGNIRYRGDQLVNTVADGLYHLGFEIEGDYILNEDGDRNANLGDLATWLNNFYLGVEKTFGTENADRIKGLNVDEEVWGRDGNDTVYANDGNDRVFGGNGNDRLYGQDGDDSIEGGAGDDRISGGEGDDQILGGSGNDRMSGDDGADHMQGGDGNDRLSGGNGADTLFGEDGADAISGGGGADFVSGGAGNDYLAGNDGADLLEGGAGNDKLSGGGDNDLLNGGAGNDRLSGQDGDDLLNGGDGDDRMSGGDGSDRLEGGTGDDRLSGGGGSDVLNAGAGNDYLSGGDGEDLLNGDEGNDKLSGGGGNDRLNGAAGDDRLYGGDGNDHLEAGDGNNRLSGGSGDDLLNAGSGNDSLSGGDGKDELNAGAGDDRLSGGGGDDLLNAGDGNDKLCGSDGNDLLNAGEGNDRLYGGGGNDLLNGEGGDDRLSGGDGDDRLEAGEGNNSLSGGAGNDLLNAGSGNDYLSGNDGDDLLNAGDGDNKLSGGDGDDSLNAGSGNDRLYGGDGNDALEAGAGNDRLGGGDGNDLLNGGSGNDYLSGDDGNDELNAGDGDDKLSGGGGNDKLNGGAGADRLYGGDGDDLLEANGDGANDLLIGGDGADTYRFDVEQGETIGRDTIKGFSIADGDELVFGDGVASFELEYVSSKHTLVTLKSADNQVLGEVDVWGDLVPAQEAALIDMDIPVVSQPGLVT